MGNQKMNQKTLFTIVAVAVAVLAAVAVLLIALAGSGEPTGQTDGLNDPNGLYWNADRLEYQVKPGEDVGSTGRKPDADGYYHILFTKDGQQLDLRIADRRLTNRIDGVEPAVMGLAFDGDGIVVDFIPLEDMALEQRLWGFFVQSMSGNMVKLNSSAIFDGIEEVIEISDDTMILDVSGQSEYMGACTELRKGDRIYAIANADGDITHIFLYERAD